MRRSTAEGSASERCRRRGPRRMRGGSELVRDRARRFVGEFARERVSRSGNRDRRLHRARRLIGPDVERAAAARGARDDGRSGSVARCRSRRRCDRSRAAARTLHCGHRCCGGRGSGFRHRAASRRQRAEAERQLDASRHGEPDREDHQQGDDAPAMSLRAMNPSGGRHVRTTVARRDDRNNRGRDQPCARGAGRVRRRRESSGRAAHAESVRSSRHCVRVTAENRRSDRVCRVERASDASDARIRKLARAGRRHRRGRVRVRRVS